VFKANVAFIESVNAGNKKFWLEANQFADITEEEFRATRTHGYKSRVAAWLVRAFPMACLNGGLC
jgi:hypothetical protein